MTFNGEQNEKKDIKNVNTWLNFKIKRASLIKDLENDYDTTDS